MAHPYNEHRQHKVERSRVKHHLAGYKHGGRVTEAEETSSDESDGEIVRDGEHKGGRKSVFKGKSPAVRKHGGAVDGKKPKHRMDRPHRAHGGSVKGSKKTIVNVIVGKGQDQPHPMLPPPMPPRPPMMPPPGLPPGAGGPPPGLAGGPPPPGMPPMPPRKSGGRVLHASNAVKPTAEINPRPHDAAARGATESAGPGDKMPQNPPGWTESAKHKTPVQHTDGKTDGPDIGRGKPVTYRAGGAVKNASNAVKPVAVGKYPITDGSKSGEGRLQKERAAASGRGAP